MVCAISGLWLRGGREALSRVATRPDQALGEAKEALKNLFINKNIKLPVVYIGHQK